jgi:hypothetical protein
MNGEQSYASHRRWHPLTHFFVFPILFVNILLQVYNIIFVFSLAGIWHLIVAVALFALAWIARSSALRVQDRLIRLEEQLRLARLLPADLHPRIAELSIGQLAALRFCSDEELPELTLAVLSGEVKGRDNIKKRIKRWRGDFHRV